MITKEYKTHNLNFLTSIPDNYDQEKNYDVIFLMHGFGANMYDLLSLAPMINQSDFIYVFPNAPLEVNLGFEQKGYAWFPIESNDYVESLDLLNKTIDEALSLFLPNEIYIGGFSQGGMMAIHAGLLSERDYKGIIALSSKLIESKKFDIEKNKIENTRLFISHGNFDSIIHIDDGRHMKNKLEELGLSVTYKEYNIAHEISDQVIKDLSDWFSKY